MKSFFKMFFASCLGVFVAMFLVPIIIIGIAAAGFVGNNEPTYTKDSILKLSLENFIPEKTDNVEVSFTSFQTPPEAIGLTRIGKLIDAAAKDDKIAGILLENNSVAVGQASLLVLTKKLEEFKKSGKFIYSYADNHTQSSYMLSSVADSMFINPLGGVDLKGFGSVIPFIKGSLDKLGVKVNIFYAGDFKSATEPLRRYDMSEYNRLQTREFLEDMEAILVDEISKNRNIPVDSIRSIMANLNGRTAKLALESKLVDGLFYKDEMDDFLRNKMGIKEGKKIKTVTLSSYDQLAKIKPSSGIKDKIAIVYAEGNINYGTNKMGEINDVKYIKLLQKIRNDKNVKAVVLRVNSPGGSAFTSEMIWREIEKIKEAGIPVIASYGDYAASGGYYISCAADYIVAEPNTLTGSIGVFSIIPDASELMNDKLGVTFDTVKTHEFATGISTVMSLSDREKELLQESTVEIYDLFLDRVSKGRGLSLDSTNQIARGRVWTGRAAKDIGLVDELGGLEDALRIAADKAGIENYKTIEYPFIEESLMETILKNAGKMNNDEDALMKIFSSKQEVSFLKNVRDVKDVFINREPQARLPYVFIWN